MNENPQKEDGHVGIANELVEALSRTNLTAYESRVLWCIFRKTYGWNKKEDWISLSQISLMTGMHKSHASRAKKLLILRNMVTPRGNKLAFNKFYSQWKELPHGVNNHSKAEKVTPRGNLPPAPRGNLGVPHGALQKTTYTKDNLTNKTEPKKKTMTDDEAGARFRSLLIEQQWCDDHYAEKTWDQGCQLSGADRVEFMRKVRYMLAIAKLPAKAKIIYHEIAGLVNDRGAMKKALTPSERYEREEWADNNQPE